MKLTKIKAEPITRAEQISLSQNFVVCCTRGSVSVLERATLCLIKKIGTLSHAVAALVSPDEKWVLILATNDTFYVLSLDTYKIRKYVIEGAHPCGCLINGCWSFDGKSIYILVYNSSVGTSAVRRYTFNAMLEKRLAYVDMIQGKYYFRCMRLVPEINKCLLLGIDRDKQDENREDYHTIVKFDGESIEEYPLPEFERYISPSYIDYDKSTQRITLIEAAGLTASLGLSVCFEEIDGKMCRVENDSKPDFQCSIDDEETIAAILNAAGCECNDVSEIVQSSNKSVYYISCSKGLIVVDSETLDVVARIRIKHGIQKTVEFGTKYIGIATLDGLRVYEIL